MTSPLRRTASAQEVKNRLTGSAVRRRLPFILALTIAAAAVGWVAASQRASTYSATGVVELTDDLSGQSIRTVGIDEVEAQRQVLLSNDMRLLLETELGEDAAGLKSISVDTSLETSLLTISVSGTSDQVAVNGTNALIDLFTAGRVVYQRDAFIAQRDDAQGRVIEQEQEVRRLTEELETAASDSEYRAFYLRQQNAVAFLQGLEAEFQQIDSEVALSDGRTNVIDRPVAATASKLDPTQMALLGGLLGLLIASSIVVAMSSRNRIIQVVEELDGIAPNIDVLATVPKFRREFRERRNSIVVGRPEAMREAEAFRFVRTAIELATEGRQNYSLAITSSAPGEGKTVTAANLAVSLSAAGSRTLLIDGDLLAPSLPELSGRPNATNVFPHLISGLSPAELAVDIGDEDRPLHLLVNDAIAPLDERRLELVPSRLRDVFNGLRDQYQTVVIDCPPVLLVSDAMSTAAAADFTIVIARLGQARRRDLVRTIERLRQADARVLGIIATHDNSDGRRYGGYGRYGDGGQTSRGAEKVTN
ncbi:MAG: capsular exopolysaccharide synthesis family protein [Candidatus Poriferisodalaceae bacterium]|jgi:capsular exopolysaccharide synthesis family protein